MPKPFGSKPLLGYGYSVEATNTLGSSGTSVKQPLGGTVRWSSGAFTISTGDLLCAVAGRYLVIGMVSWNVGSVVNSRLQVEIEVNAAGAVPRIVTTIGSPTQAGQNLQAIGIVNLVIGDRIRLMALQQTGADRTPTFGAVTVEMIG